MVQEATEKEASYKKDPDPKPRAKKRNVLRARNDAR
jgi:hypothetical protein